MNQKEWREVGRQLGYFLASLALLALIVALGEFLSTSPVPFSEKYQPMAQMLLLLYSLLSGMATFAREKKQKGMEYLLSLPQPRLQLLRDKLLPRFSLTLLLCFCFVVATFILPHEHWLLSIFAFSILYFALHIIAVSILLFSNNFIELFAFAVVMTLVYLAAIVAVFALRLAWTSESVRVQVVSSLNDALFIKPQETRIWMVLPWVLLLLPFPLALVRIFRRFDLRPLRTHLRRFFAFLAPAMLLALGLAWGILYLQLKLLDSYWRLTLMNDLRLVKSYYDGKIEVFASNGKQTIKTDFHRYFVPVFQEGSYLYSNYQYNGLDADATVDRLNLESMRLETLHAYLGERSIDFIQWKWGERLLWLERQPVPYNQDRSYRYLTIPHNTIYLAIFDIASRHKKLIPFVRSEFSALQKGPWLIGADRLDGRDFWLLKAYSEKKNLLLRIWEDGRVDDLGSPNGHFFLCRHLLFCERSQSLEVYRLGEKGLEKVKEFPGTFNFGYYYFFFNNHNLGGPTQPVVYLRNKYDIVAIDLEILSLRTLRHYQSILENRLIVLPDRVLITEDRPGGGIRVLDIGGEKPRLIGEFSWPGKWFAEASPAGIIFYSWPKNIIHVCAFPDLREIKYKGLD